MPRLVNLTMRVSEYKGALVFLHEVAHGAADRSYGIQVAKLAGLPASVVQTRARRAGRLEAPRPAGAIDALPLFSYEPPPPPPPRARPVARGARGARSRRYEPARGARGALCLKRLTEETP